MSVNIARFEFEISFCGMFNITTAQESIAGPSKIRFELFFVLDAIC